MCIEAFQEAQDARAERRAVGSGEGHSNERWSVVIRELEGDQSKPTRLREDNAKSRTILVSLAYFVRYNQFSFIQLTLRSDF